MSSDTRPTFDPIVFDKVVCARVCVCVCVCSSVFISRKNFISTTSGLSTYFISKIFGIPPVCRTCRWMGSWR
jgi:hypothetical protein